MTPCLPWGFHRCGSHYFHESGVCPRRTWLLPECALHFRRVSSARVSALSDRQKCVVNAVRFLALRACSAFGISRADMGAFPLIDVPAFGRREIFGERYAFVVFQLSVDFSHGTRGHTLSVVFYGHGMISAVRHRLSPLKIKTEAASFGGLNMRCMSVRLSPSPRFVVLNATASRAIPLTSCPIVRVLCAPQAKC